MVLTLSRLDLNYAHQWYLKNDWSGLLAPQNLDLKPCALFAILLSILLADPDDKKNESEKNVFFILFFFFSFKFANFEEKASLAIVGAIVSPLFDGYLKGNEAC